ncbi:uncharacterized protein LOC131221487 isoform X1 [Magnolia sinica]|uniref:uncharacterized protein LOC131221487 isoform X1 n=1 Tax=Magnolia sinica TaxID=86752 RepID=UPI002659E7A5|nr:uncharacterized protein LOC131221487 isoform X1 [Magnolia sinica]XP_058072730.1 uncharacterized protein LOC131221487 isoform X1 [Magnolia sinica]XP_058072731.1 uncharacterized protein LOC131221487 isoform X1 [Magnolia sinica]XP_058072732.1 uncharacterized protein LOC131221487 isoform X1 [Magnolia sinica]
MPVARGRLLQATSTSLLATKVLKSLMGLCLHAFQCIPAVCEFPTAFQKMHGLCGIIKLGAQEDLALFLSVSSRWRRSRECKCRGP